MPRLGVEIGSRALQYSDKANDDRIRRQGVRASQTTKEARTARKKLAAHVLELHEQSEDQPYGPGISE